MIELHFAAVRDDENYRMRTFEEKPGKRTGQMQLRRLGKQMKHLFIS